MHFLQLIACFSLLVPIATIILRDGNNRGNSYSSSSSSEEGNYGGKKHHGGHHGGNHGNRPPPRPVPKPCDDDWHAFYRPQGVWCVRIVAATLDYFAAMTACTNLGGSLSGIQNNEERIWMANKSMEILTANGQTDSGTWLGASCTIRGCVWTDWNTVGTEGMLWAPGEPANLNFSPPCIYIYSLAGATLSQKPPNSNGFIDDSYCRGYKTINSYACGKVGLRNN